MIVQQAAQLLNASGGGFYFSDSARQEVRCEVSYQTPHDYTGVILKYGEGVAGTVAFSGQPLIISDYRTWAKRAAVYEDEKPFRSVISVPVIWQGQVTGVLIILDDETRHFTIQDLELLTLLANQAAIAIENARLLAQTAKEQRHLSLLHDINHAVTRSLDPDEIMNQALALTCQALGGITGEAFIYHPEEDQLSLRAIYGGYGVSLEEGNALLFMRPGKGLTGWVAKHRQAVCAPDVSLDERWEFIPILD
jgi:GAF domain-containing protein